MRQLSTAIIIALMVFCFPSAAMADIPGLSDAASFFTNFNTEAGRIALAIIGTMVIVAVLQVARGNAAGWWIIFGCISGVLILAKWPAFSAYVLNGAVR